MAKNPVLNGMGGKISGFFRKSIFNKSVYTGIYALVRNLCLFLVFAIALSMIVGSIVREIVTGNALYGDISVGEELQAIGYTESFVAEKLSDSLNALSSSAKDEALSYKDDGLSALRPDAAPFALVVPTSSISPESAINVIRSFIGFPRTSVSEKWFKNSAGLFLNVKVGGSASKTFSLASQGQVSEGAIESLSQKAAEYVVETLEPYRLAYYYFQLSPDGESVYQKFLKYVGLCVSGGDSSKKVKALALWAAYEKRAKNYGKAKEFINRALEIDPNYLPAYLSLADIALSTGDLVSSKEATDRVKEIGSPAWRFLDIQISVAGKKFAETTKKLDTYLEQLGTADKIDLLIRTSLLLRNKGRLNDGIKTLEKAIEYKPIEYPLVYLVLAIEYKELGSKSKAQEYESLYLKYDKASAYSTVYSQYL